CNGTQNAVAVFQFKPCEAKLLGLIPVGWFPGAIVHDSRRNMLYVANIKDITRTKEKPRPGLGNTTGFNTREFAGSLSLVPVPSKTELPGLNQIDLRDLRYPLLEQAKLPARADIAPQP